VGEDARALLADDAHRLKPALARGTLQLMGATTFNEYRTTIEKDAVLARRFQPVQISEPSVEETVSILRGLRSRYEAHHGVSVADSALVSAATLAHRYLSDRRLPDGAIDLVDEASSALRLQQESKPEAVESLDRRIQSIEIELESLRRETDSISRERHETLTQELEKLRSQSEGLLSKWNDIRGRLENIKNIKHEIEMARIQLEQAQRTGDFQRAAELVTQRLGVEDNADAPLADCSTARSPACRASCRPRRRQLPPTPRPRRKRACWCPSASRKTPSRRWWHA